VVKCASCDSVIFRVDDGSFALVHLTWAQHPEPDPWPDTQRLGGFIALESAIDNHQHCTVALTGPMTIHLGRVSDRLKPIRQGSTEARQAGAGSRGGELEVPDD
jgi:hypothetical protein